MIGRFGLRLSHDEPISVKRFRLPYMRVTTCSLGLGM